MTKDELRDYMIRVTHELGLPEGRFRYDANNITWQTAFKLARLAGHEDVEHGCSKCIAKIAEWMIK